MHSIAPLAALAALARISRVARVAAARQGLGVAALAAGALLALPCHAAGNSKEMNALIGKPFSTTREALLTQGWVPMETNLTTSRGAAERERGEAGRFLQAGFNEIERCTGGQKNYCFLNYNRRGKCLRLRTLGALDLPAHDPKIHGAGDACPSKQKAPH